ncbi:3-ketoacyl-ACP reductase [Pseudomonas carnis]|nr:3-ketoacyl-ACP reductase [Pseudomonas carnis]MBV2085399.1 3-ketoacyl-ACP reductase [Pseudomonas carnis]
MMVVSQHSKRGVALVTGGRRGIGRAICVALASRGYDIAVLDIVNDEAVVETLSQIESLGRRAQFYRYDLSQIEQRFEVIDQIEGELGSINCLVNNAGIQTPVRGDLLEVTEANFDLLMDVNLRGTFFITQEVSKRMIQRDTEHRSIITITSANAHLVSPEKGSYGVSKAALSMANQQFALRLADTGISVYEIRPGLIQTDMTLDVRERYSDAIQSGDICPQRRWGMPADIGEAVASLACGALPFSTGDIYNIGGGMQIPKL